MKLCEYIGETSAYDKKVMLERSNPVSWLKSVSAFANTLGGKLLFGVSNEGDLVGLADAEKDAEDISEAIKMQILEAYKIASTRLGREFVPTFHSDATDFVVTLPNLQYGMRDVQNAAEVVQAGVKSVTKATQKTTQIATQKSTHKSTQKTTQKILLAIANNPNVTRKELADMIGITPDGIKKAMEGLKKAGLIGRVGGKKGGHWEVIGS